MWPYLLIPLCAILNHLGGQSMTIPDPRVTARMIAPGIVFGIIAWLAGVDLPLAMEGGITVIAGLALWAVWPWAQGFMVITGADSRNYNKLGWLCHLCDYILGVNQLTKLTVRQCKLWGFVFMTVRGAFLYPLYITLAFLFTPSALAIGPLCLLQGGVYYIGGRNYGANAVLGAEYIMGIIIGASLAAILLIHLGG